MESLEEPRLLSKDGEMWRLLVSMAWQFTQYGIPMIWYGSEFGFTGLCFRDGSEKMALLDRRDPY